MIDCVKVQPHLLFLIRSQLGPFFWHFWDPLELFVGLGSGSKKFWGLLMETINFVQWKCSPMFLFLFLIQQHFGPLFGPDPNPTNSSKGPKIVAELNTKDGAVVSHNQSCNLSLFQSQLFRVCRCFSHVYCQAQPSSNSSFSWRWAEF